MWRPVEPESLPQFSGSCLWHAVLRYEQHVAESYAATCSCHLRLEPRRTMDDLKLDDEPESVAGMLKAPAVTHESETISIVGNEKPATIPAPENSIASTPKLFLKPGPRPVPAPPTQVAPQPAYPPPSFRLQRYIPLLLIVNAILMLVLMLVFFFFSGHR